MKANKLLVFLLTVLFLYLYVTSAKSIAPIFEILQTNLPKFQTNMLHEKLPIVLEDQIVDVQEVIRNVFRYLYIYRYNDTSLSFPFQIVICKSRYTIIYNADNLKPFHINLYHPKYTTQGINSNDPITSNRHILVYPKFDTESQIIRLHPNKMIIIPYKWAYSIHDDVANVQPQLLFRIHLHDLVTYLT